VLEPLGLSRTAEAVYRTMLAHRAWGVAEVAEHLGLTTQRVRAALDQLADLALLTLTSAGADAVDPLIGLPELLAKAERKALQHQQQIDATRAAIAAIAAEYATVRDRDSADRLDGVAAVRDRLAELSRIATRECISLNPTASQTPAATSAGEPLNERMLARGITIRGVYQDNILKDARLVAYARWLTTLGGQARTTPTVPMLLVIYDREIAILPIDPHDSSTGAVEIRNSSVLALACALFEQIWSSARPLGDAPNANDAQPSAMHRQLLRILAAGHTDELAAKRLGISITTARRMMADIMNLLNARSRFQAGIQAAERGWLHSGPATPSGKIP